MSTKEYRSKTTVRAASVEEAVKDASLLELFTQSGASFYTRSEITSSGEEYSPRVYVNAGYTDEDGTGKVIVKYDDTTAAYKNSRIDLFTQSKFDNMFAPVEDGDNPSAPETSISDYEFKLAACRATVFMESGCRKASDPHKATNVSGDKGGLTKYGISAAAYPNVDIANLTYDDALQIYVDKVWPEAKANLLPRPLNALMFDLDTTSGLKNATRVLQRAVGANDDGIWGPETQSKATAACSTFPKMLDAVRLFTEKRIAFYQAIVANNSSQAKFLNGWINRATRSQCFAMALLHTTDIL